MYIMHNNGARFSDTETDDVFSVEEVYSGDDTEWWVEESSAYDDVNKIILGRYKTQAEAVEALGKLYDACLNNLQGFVMP